MNINDSRCRDICSCGCERREHRKNGRDCDNKQCRNRDSQNRKKNCRQFCLVEKAS